MPKLRLLFTSIAACATALTLTPLSRADEETEPPPPPFKPRRAAMSLSGEVVTVLLAHDNGDLYNAFCGDVLIRFPVRDRYNFYAGAGFGLVTARVRAGVDWIPLGRNEVGPDLMLGVRPFAALFIGAPSNSLPPGATQGQQLTWAGEGLLAELGLGLRFPGSNDGDHRDFRIMPTALAGPVRYATRGSTNRGPQETYASSAFFYGGTLALVIDY